MSEIEKLQIAVGRKQVALEELQAQTLNLLQTLADVVSGKTARSRVIVNLTAHSWDIAPEGQRPCMPATINGVPICVIAPDDPVQNALDAIAQRNAKEPGEIEVTMPVQAG